MSALTGGCTACFAILEKAGGRLELVDEPCRSVIVVVTAWGVIGNGGVEYLFEVNFQGEPEYAVFTDAFRRVGFEDVAQRFSELFGLFPFPDPHKDVKQRHAFLRSPPARFSSLMEEIEGLVYGTKDLEGNLEAYVQATAPAADSARVAGAAAGGTV